MVVNGIALYVVDATDDVPAHAIVAGEKLDAEACDRLAAAAARLAADLRPSTIHYQRPENGRIACGDVSGLFAWGREHVTCPPCLARVSDPLKPAEPAAPVVQCPHPVPGTVRRCKRHAEHEGDCA